ncbi:hypothetical protein VKI22_08920 [Cyanobacterium aponinum UTEX 3221]|uniref:hypothetical protein n=1 Tax=Cyanobacterium aponinum TaxID=379064 RepID=UPI002B4BC9EB|nr:hypothetical protein [Cyanobacterium aponinum]WRL40183.1 hypothetical protein VKI22_08920 [Cyanobacterium aponinum UTEX 3221]
MNSRRRNQEHTEDLNINNAFTDLMSNAFMILSFFLLLIIFQLWQGKKENLFLRNQTANLPKIDAELKKIKAENNELKQVNDRLKQENKNLSSASPIIIDEKSGNFKFPSGSAELSSDLKQYIINTITPQVNKVINEQDIDFIQVIGHTDGQVIGATGNLDLTLEKVAQNQVQVGILKAGSNADLGLMRALAVVQELSQQEELKGINFRAYSAAQLYLPSGDLADVNRKEDEARRRIEIRFIPPGKRNN